MASDEESTVSESSGDDGDDDETLGPSSSDSSSIGGSSSSSWTSTNQRDAIIAKHERRLKTVQQKKRASFRPTAVNEEASRTGWNRQSTQDPVETTRNEKRQSIGVEMRNGRPVFLYADSKKEAQRRGWEPSESAIEIHLPRLLLVV